MKQKVNLFIIGAPKCGTTSLANYLNQSREILLPEVKEPHYFKGSLPGPHSRYVTNFEDYENLFRNHKKSTSLYWLDASVWYYSNEQSAEEIFAYNPEARLLFLARSPKEAIISLFKHRLAALNEDQLNINNALRLIPDRKSGKKLPLTLTTTRQGLFYVENYQYAKKLKRFQELFQDRLKIVLFDDLTKEPEKTLTDVCQWLVVEPWQFILDKKYNEAKAPRNRGLSRALRILSPKMKQRMKSLWVARIIVRFVSSVIPHKESILQLDSYSLELLQEQLNNEIEAFANIVNRDLSHWKI